MLSGGVNKNPSVPSIFSGLDKSDLKKITDGSLDSMKKFAITSTALLPISSRGVVLNTVRTPMRLLQSTGSGLKQAIKNENIKNLGSNIATEMKGHMKNDWQGGIADREIPLKKGDPVVLANLKYSQFMQGTSKLGFAPEIDNIRQGIDNLGFENNGQGKYYHPETGTVLHLVHDTVKNEFIVCFGQRLSETRLGDRVDNKVKEKMSMAVDLGIVSDFLGGIPKNAIQAMQIGQMLKEKTAGTGLTPVVVGFSHGGGLAQCAAAANGINGVVFNSRPMGASVRRYIGSEKIAENAKKITAFSGRGDFLSNTRGLNALAVFTERILGIPVPRTVGKSYYVPVDPNITDKTFVGKLDDGHTAIFSQLEDLAKE